MPFFGNLGAGEMILIGLVLLLVFGAKRLPELGSGLGKGIREFKKSVKDITNEVDRVDDNREIRPPQSRPAVPPTTERNEYTPERNEYSADEHRVDDRR